MEKYMWRCGKQKASLMEMRFFLHIQFDYICCIVLFTPQYSSRRFAIFKSFESYVFVVFSWKQSHSLWKHCRSQSQSTAIRMSARSLICMSLGRFHGLSRCLKHQHICNRNAHDYRNRNLLNDYFMCSVSIGFERPWLHHLLLLQLTVQFNAHTLHYMYRVFDE